MYKIQVFDEAFFFLATVATITKKVTVSSFHSNHCNRNKFFPHNHADYQSKLSLKSLVQQIKFAQKKLLQRCIFYPTAKYPDPKDGAKMQK